MVFLKMNKDNFNVYYFAFGSNMNIERVKERKVKYLERFPATLKGYRLVFNKPDFNEPGLTYANIQPEENSIVEGALYLTDMESIKILDGFEGVPVHYLRKEIEVISYTGDIIKAWVYIAIEDTLKPGKPSKDYLGHLLAGKDLLSENYYEQLISVQTFL